MAEPVGPQVGDSHHGEGSEEALQGSRGGFGLRRHRLSPAVSPCRSCGCWCHDVCSARAHVEFNFISLLSCAKIAPGHGESRGGEAANTDPAN